MNERAFEHEQIGKLIEVKPIQLNKGERDFVCDIQRFFDKNTAFFSNKKLYLLRNKSKKGIGFFDTTGFYPDFIVWLVVGEHQYVAFVDPKGISHIDGFGNPKIALHKTIREEIEPNLKDKDISLSSFIVSNTAFRYVKHWTYFMGDKVMKGVPEMKAFNENNITRYWCSSSIEGVKWFGFFIIYCTNARWRTSSNSSYWQGRCNECRTSCGTNAKHDGRRSC